MSARGMYGASKQRRSLTVGRETYQIWTQMVLMAAVGIVYTPLSDRYFLHRSGLRPVLSCGSAYLIIFCWNVLCWRQSAGHYFLKKGGVRRGWIPPIPRNRCPFPGTSYEERYLAAEAVFWKRWRGKLAAADEVVFTSHGLFSLWRGYFHDGGSIFAEAEGVFSRQPRGILASRGGAWFPPPGIFVAVEGYFRRVCIPPLGAAEGK